MTGSYSTAPGLTLTNTAIAAEDRLIFQIDRSYHDYLYNKRQCRTEDIEKYYLTDRLSQTTIQTINRYILNRLLQEYPGQFRLHDGLHLENVATDEKIEFSPDWVNLTDPILQYVSLFDALCSQVQEDIAVIQLTAESDYLTAIHLCSPNHWSPAEKIGKPFDAIHQPVPAIETTIVNYRKILNTILNKQGPFCRFAWGIGTDNRLNHHPQAPLGLNAEQWQGRSQPGHSIPLFVRVERQNLIGFPKINAILFTIRTYLYDVDSLSNEEKLKLFKAIQTMTPETIIYKGLENWQEELENRLNNCTDSLK